MSAATGRKNAAEDSAAFVVLQGGHVFLCQLADPQAAQAAAVFRTAGAIGKQHTAVVKLVDGNIAEATAVVIFDGGDAFPGCAFIPADSTDHGGPGTGHGTVDAPGADVAPGNGIPDGKQTAVAKPLHGKGRIGRGEPGGFRFCPGSTVVAGEAFVLAAVVGADEAPNLTVFQLYKARLLNAGGAVAAGGERNAVNQSLPGEAVIIGGVDLELTGGETFRDLPLAVRGVYFMGSQRV